MKNSCNTSKDPRWVNWLGLFISEGNNVIGPYSGATNTSTLTGNQLNVVDPVRTCSPSTSWEIRC